jgi:hypothetical protein
MKGCSKQKCEELWTLPWWYHMKAVEQAFMEGVLLGDVAEIGFVANSLTLLDRDDPARLRALLEMEIENTTRNAAEILGTGVRLDDFPIPNMSEGVRRASVYAEAHGLERAAQDSELILTCLKGWAKE